MFQRIVTRVPMYDEDFVQPMRDELTSVGFEELKTPEEVDRAITESKGVVFAVINSVCGCAAGSARPGVRMALVNKVIPDRLVTAFAGQEKEAVERLRQEHLQDYPPSSPSMALFKDGKPVYMMERRQIEGRNPAEIAQELKRAFDQFCSKQT